MKTLSIPFLLLFSLLADPAFACTVLIGIAKNSPDVAKAKTMARISMVNFKAAHLIQSRSFETFSESEHLFCFHAASQDYVELIRADLKANMADYSGVTVTRRKLARPANPVTEGYEEFVTTTTTTNGTLTCRSPEVQQAIQSCFSRRPNCPLSPYCSWAYGWYERCATRRPNRYCFH